MKTREESNNEKKCDIPSFETLQKQNAFAEKVVMLGAEMFEGNIEDFINAMAYAAAVSIHTYVDDNLHLALLQGGKFVGCMNLTLSILDKVGSDMSTTNTNDHDTK